MNIVISNSGEIPIYEQIASQIKSAVIAGEVKPGEPLPSLRFLAKELRVSVISTKRAYEELEREDISLQFREREASPQRSTGSF